MEINIFGELTIMKQLNIKPNYSDLSRRYGLDRHTIKKYYDEGGKIVKQRKRKHSKYDSFKEEITNVINKPGVTKKAAFEFLKDRYPNFDWNYNGLKDFINSRQLDDSPPKKPHVRFETEPGEELQVDWKESLKLHDKKGKEYLFNVFTGTLGYSREHLFVYSLTKTTEDFLRCMIDVLKRIGLPKRILTDNMAAIVSIRNGKKHKHPKIVAFEKDIGVKIKLCKARSPETKGKDESSNRFVNWVKAYDYDFVDENELINIIQRIESKANQEINKTTGIPPIVLFAKEKEYLSHIPNKLLLESYLQEVHEATVPSTLLVSYKGKGYSVPVNYINKKVKIYPVDNKIYIYFKDELISTHDVSITSFNYKEEHYVQALSSYYEDQRQIEAIAKDNLERLDALKKGNIYAK